MTGNSRKGEGSAEEMPVQEGSYIDPDMGASERHKPKNHQAFELE